MPKTSVAPRARAGRGFAVALAIFSLWLALAPAGAQVLGERRIVPPAAIGNPSTSLSAGDQLQMQLYRDELQTRQRQLEDRGGTSPFSGVATLHNQERLNAIGR